MVDQCWRGGPSGWRQLPWPFTALWAPPKSEVPQVHVALPPLQDYDELIGSAAAPAASGDRQGEVAA